MAKQNMRGQILSTDIVISLSFFLGAILIYLLAWSSLSYQYLEAKEDANMQSSLVMISDALALTPGFPSSWESGAPQSASSFGVASSQNVLSSEKLGALQSEFASNYSFAKARSGAGKYEIYITVIGTKGENIYGFGYEQNYTDRQVSSVMSERLCELDGKLVSLKVKIWRARGGAI